MTLSEFFEKEIGKIGVFTSSSTPKKRTSENQSEDCMSPSIPLKRRRQYVNMLTDISSIIRAVDAKLSATSSSTASTASTASTESTASTASTAVEKKSILQQYIDQQWEERRQRVAEQRAYQQKVCGTVSLPVSIVFYLHHLLAFIIILTITITVPISNNQ